MSDQAESTPSGLLDGIRKNAGLTVVSGIVLIVAGTFAILSPLYAGLSITILVGAMLAIGGIGECFLAFKAGAFGRGLVIFIVGVLMAIVGFYMMTQPVAGLAKITLFLAIYFFATGLIESAVAFQIKPAEGWRWQLANGIVTLLLGILLWRQFPLSGAWAVGVLFGIKMVSSGWALVFIGRHVKQAAKTAAVSI